MDKLMLPVQIHDYNIKGVLMFALKFILLFM